MKLTTTQKLTETPIRLGIAVALLISANALQATPTSAEPLKVENTVLTSAPNVPPPITRREPAKVIVNLEVKEVTKRLADGVQYTFWTFGGSVPGKFIRIREGDEVEFHLNNSPDSKMPHNIDLHAVSGPGGGATSSFTAPGHSSQFSFTALNPGLYVYHCATAPVGMHVGNGMYGLILVEPKEGLSPVDHEYYVMQGEFYTPGKFGEEGLQTFDMDKAVDERPTYVLFNGAVGSLTGDNTLTAKVGEKIRIFVGDGGPNLTSSFHIIGTIFDTVYPEGGTTPLHNVQTTVIPPGGAATVEFTTKVPGTYTMVDHSLFRAFNKGAVGTLTVSGEENKIVYSGKQADTLYAGTPGSNDTGGSASVSSIAAPPVVATPPESVSALSAGILSPDFDPVFHSTYQRGKQVYMQTCFVCHQPNGQGLLNQFPPLAKSDLLMKDKEGAIRGVLRGRSGEISVNGKKFNAIMAPLAYLSDQQVADVITYVRNSWGNSDTNFVSAEYVSQLRKTSPALTANPFE